VRLPTFVILLSCLLLSLQDAPARAQTEPGALERAAARKLYDEGRIAAEERRWTEARNAWQQSHALVPNALVLVSLAGAQAQTGQLVQARESYQRFLLQLDAETQHLEAHVRAQISALEARLAHVQLREAPADAEVVLDGAALAAALVTTELPVDPGAHVLELRAPGYEPWSAQVTLAEGQHLELAYEGVPLAPSIPKPEASAPLASEPVSRPAAPASERAPASTTRRRRALWFSVAGAVVAGAAVGLAVGLSRRNHELEPDGDVFPTPGNEPMSIAAWLVARRAPRPAR
jgi:hypothetical protein